VPSSDFLFPLEAADKEPPDFIFLFTSPLLDLGGPPQLRRSTKSGAVEEIFMVVFGMMSSWKGPGVRQTGREC